MFYYGKPYSKYEIIARAAAEGWGCRKSDRSQRIFTARQCSWAQTALESSQFNVQALRLDRNQTQKKIGELKKSFKNVGRGSSQRPTSPEPAKQGGRLLVSLPESNLGYFATISIWTSDAGYYGVCGLCEHKPSSKTMSDTQQRSIRYPVQVPSNSIRRISTHLICSSGPCLFLKR